MEGTGTSATAMLVGTPEDVGGRPDAATVTLAAVKLAIWTWVVVLFTWVSTAPAAPPTVTSVAESVVALDNIRP